MFKPLTIALLLATSCQAFSQTMPSQNDIAAQRKAIQDAMKSPEMNSSPTRGQTRLQMQSNAAAMNAMSALPGVNQPISKSTNADFMNLSRPGAAAAIQNRKSTALSSDLMVFVSLSMPDQMLMQYAAQAKRFNAVLMLRGFVGDKLSTTRETLSKLNESGAQWEISPEPFKTFKIDKVPAIVLATAESTSITEEGCAKPETYTAIFGDIAIIDALDKFSLLGQKRIATMAKARLAADRLAGKKG